MCTLPPDLIKWIKLKGKKWGGGQVACLGR